MTMWLIIVAVLAFVPPLYLRMTAKGDVSFTLNHRSYHRTLFVHMPGLMGDGVTQIENVIETFTGCGDMLAIHYDGKYGKDATTFDWREAVDATVSAITIATRYKQYDKIVFIGTSMGGKLAFMAAQRLRSVNIKSKAILVDAPLGRRDFQPLLDITSPVLRFLPYVPVVNLFYVVPLLGRLVIENAFVAPPKEEQIAPSLTAVERARLDDSVVEARKTKMPFHRAEVLSILADLPDRTSPWDRKDVVYIRSAADSNTVRAEAFDSWAKLLGGKCHRLTVPDAQHCSYGQKPSKYRPAFRSAFKILGVS